MDARIRKGYDFLARFYDALVFLLFGNRLKRAREALLGDLPNTGHVGAVILGGGTGSFLEALIRSGKTTRILFVDLSPVMIERAWKRIAAMETGSYDSDEIAVDFLQSSAEELPARAEFDLICTNFFLDSFAPEELTRLMNHIVLMLRPGGLWYFSDFQGGPRPLISLLYSFFRTICKISAVRLPDYNAEFLRLGLELQKEKWSGGGMLRTAIYRKPAPGK